MSSNQHVQGIRSRSSVVGAPQCDDDDRAYLENEFGIVFPVDLNVVSVRCFDRLGDSVFTRQTKGVEFTEVRITVHAPRYKRRSQARRTVEKRRRAA